MRRVWLVWLLLAMCPGPGWAACTLTWDRPTVNADASPLDSGVPLTYRVYVASTPGGYTAGSPLTTTTSLSIACATVCPGGGPCYVAVSAVKDSNGLEGVFSGEVGPPGTPGAIGGR
jgi:hypothetical protein